MAENFEWDVLDPGIHIPDIELIEWDIIEACSNLEKEESRNYLRKLGFIVYKKIVTQEKPLSR